MGQTYLVVEEVYGEVGAVAVGNCGHVFQRVAKTFFKHFRTTSRATEHKRQICGLRYPRPVESAVDIAARLIKTDYGGFLYQPLYNVYRRTGLVKHLTDDIG